MKTFLYKRSTKITFFIIQGLLAGLLVLCLLGIRSRTRMGYTLSEMSGSFERSDIFFSSLENTIRRKIDYDRNIGLFERAGQYDETRSVDIRQYASGILDEAGSNSNTAYRIKDLIYFNANGRADMERAVGEAIAEGRGEDRSWEMLQSKSGVLETIIPVSGNSLASYASLSANPGTALLEYYQNLCETSADIGARYEQYKSYSEKEGLDSRSDAPSNVSYYVENTTTKQRYTNMEVNSLVSARSVVSKDEEREIVFEGERRFNIMVANTENVLNSRAADYFMPVRFSGTSEKILIAVDTEFPVGDSLYTTYTQVRKIRPLMIAAIVISAVSAVLLVILMIASCIVSGRNGLEDPFGEETVVMSRFDQVPTEIAAGFCLIALIGWALIARYTTAKWSLDAGTEIIGGGALASVEYMLALFSLLSLVVRAKAGSIRSNSIISMVMRGSEQVYSAKARTKKVLAGFIALVTLNMIFLLALGMPGMIMSLALDLSVLLYLMRDAVGNQNVYEGLKQISTGKLDYRINPEVLTGESREMALAVNEMGKGLEKAVEDMLRSERLRAELITNVSHDLKTPLTSIINYVDLLRRRNLEDPQAQEYIEILERKTARLKSLTEDLIEVSKISSGNIELHPVNMQLQQFMQMAIGEFEERLEEKKLILHADIPRNSAWISADGDELWRVLENLLSNIAKYAKEGTEVKVSMESSETETRVSISNIPDRPIMVSAQQLMERFTRGDVNRSTEGSGLGLSIASSLTELMGGKFELDVEEQLFCAVLTFPLIVPEKNVDKSRPEA